MTSCHFCRRRPTSGLLEREDMGQRYLRRREQLVKRIRRDFGVMCSANLPAHGHINPVSGVSLVFPQSASYKLLYESSSPASEGGKCLAASTPWTPCTR